MFLDNREVANALSLPTEGGRVYLVAEWRDVPGYKGGAWQKSQ